MRFPSQIGSIAGVTITVTDLARADRFWCAVLKPLGFGRVGTGADWKLWARDGAQVMIRQGSPPTSASCMLLRVQHRQKVDDACRQALAEGWRVVASPAERRHAPGYYSCILADPDGIQVELVHAWSDLPERDNAERVRIPGVDGVTLGGYLFRPISSVQREGQPPPAVIVLHGYGGDATQLVWCGEELAKAGFSALCLSLRGWLGSTGDEDQGFRQPDDVVAAADWLRPGARSIGLLGFSQGGQVALLAAARQSTNAFSSTVAYYPCTDLAAWRDQAPPGLGISDYLDDFVPSERISACSPVTVARQIQCPTLLVHGDKDAFIPAAQSRAMVEANSAIQLRIVPNAGHGFPMEKWPEVWRETVSFLLQNS